VFHGPASIRIRIHTAARQDRDYCLAFRATFRALFGIAECASGLCQAVDPRLQLTRNRELVEGCAQYNYVGSKELRHKRFSEFVFTQLGWGGLAVNGATNAQ